MFSFSYPHVHSSGQLYLPRLSCVSVSVAAKWEMVTLPGRDTRKIEIHLSFFSAAIVKYLDLSDNKSMEEWVSSRHRCKVTEAIAVVTSLPQPRIRKQQKSAAIQFYKVQDLSQSMCCAHWVNLPTSANVVKIIPISLFRDPSPR